VYQSSPLSLAATPFAFFDDTKVQHTIPLPKNKKENLLNRCLLRKIQKTCFKEQNRVSYDYFLLKLLAVACVLLKINM